MKDMAYILFSDGTWDSTEDYRKINKIIEKHWWPFPIDEKGDPRRKVTILADVAISEVRKGV